jgi:osmotically-inducible protein OsmY
MRKNWIAGITLLAAACAVVIFMFNRHSETGDRTTRADVTLSDNAITEALQKANLPIAELSVKSVGGIVVLRGSSDPTTATKAAEVVRSLGAVRVANLISPTSARDDEEIRRDAERHLASSRSLDGCSLRVSCANGVIRVSGTVQQELQKDAARNLLRRVPGVRQIQIDLTTQVAVAQ